MLLGAHVSTAGGVFNAPPRGAEIDATAIQLFTKQPNRWADKPIADADAAAYREALAQTEIRFATAHDSYLINLATPDPALRDRSYASFVAELERCRALDLDAVVTHPGNATDGDRARGLAQNAELIERALREVEGRTMVLVETTAGAGTALGATFEELAELLDRVAPEQRARMGVCFDTCHAFSAGYDLREAYDEVWDRFERTVGFERLRLFHLNDSQKPFDSRKDRHAHIGEGTLGEEPFRRIMRDPRFRDIPKVLETPKEDDAVKYDTRNLGLLRDMAAE